MSKEDNRNWGLVILQTHKRLISMILVCFLILLSACSSNKKSSTNESSGAGGNIPEVNMVFFTTTVPKDLNLVQDEINKITKKKLMQR